MHSLHDLFDIFGALSIFILFFKVIPETLALNFYKLYSIWQERKEKIAFQKKYPSHECDRNDDGMCLQCQINVSKALTESIFKRKDGAGTSAIG